jgi:hypothetical protein
MDPQAKERAKDTGLALVLVLLFVAHFWEFYSVVPAAIGVLLLTMIWPGVFAPLSVLWFGFSHIIGAVMSRVLLTAIFVLITTPMGVIRRLFGADGMQRKAWKKGRDSVFVRRDHVFSVEDLERPY